MRPGAIAVVAVVAALLGGSSALLIGKAAGWIDDDAGPAQPVLVPTPDGATPASDEFQDGSAARPLTGNGFDASEIYAKRAAGVVTVLAYFGELDANAANVAQGTGFVVNENGYVLTNSHVITTAGEGGAAEKPEAASTVFVQYRDSEQVPAKIVGWDLSDDVAVIKVDPRDHSVSPVPLGDSNDVVVGEPVAAIGSPFGNQSSLSVGVVSATERSIASLTSEYRLVDAIQTDAPINRGNSGGPMFNAHGEVIGINAQIRSDSGSAEGVGFAVPINAAKRSMAQLIETGRVRYAWLGIITRTITPRLAEHFDFPAERGAAIQEVVEESPAAEAGLRGGGEEEEWEGLSLRPGGDLIVAVDGREVTTAEDVVRIVTQRLLPGARTVLTVLRGEQRLEVEIVVGERPQTPPETGR